MCEAPSAFLFHEAGDGAHQVVLGEDLEARVAHFHEDCGIFVAEDVGDALDRSSARHLRQRLAHYFADDELAQILALQRHRSEEHTSELQSRSEIVCRLLLEKKK